MTIDANGNVVTPRQKPPAPAASQAASTATLEPPVGDPQAATPAAAPAQDDVAVGAPANGARAQSQLGLPGAAPAQAPEKGSWTVAVNLGTTQEQQGMTAGAERKGEELRKLADQSKGSDVTIVAQETIQNADGSASVKQYTIQDGQIQEGETRPSEGTAKDLENLVADAYTRHPAEKAALIQQSHGLGADGISGDAGKASVAETTSAIRAGLDRAGVDKLDTLNFDACLMAQTEVLDDLAPIAENVVASEELEAGRQSADGMVDGQDLNASLSALLANPGMDGKQLGDTMVDAARGNTIQVAPPSGGPRPDAATPGAYKGADHAAGTSTLANFDMKDYDAYRQGLDTLGTALDQAMADPAAKAAIQQAIEATPRMGAATDRTGTRHAERDVKAFTEQLDAAIADGSLPDPTGAIAAATRQTREDLDALAESYHGDANGAGYEDLGGLGAFLPDQAFLDTAKGARAENMATQFEGMASGLNQKFGGQTPEEQAATAEMATTKTQAWLDAARQQLPPDQQRALTDVEAAHASLVAAATPADQAAALARLDQAASAFAASPAAWTLQHEKREQMDDHVARSYANARTGDGTGGWDRFTEALRGG